MAEIDREFHFGNIVKRGETVLVQTVTNYFLGVVTDCEYSGENRWICLKPAVWVAEVGRLGNALRTGNLTECEQMPDGVAVMLDPTVTIIPWKHGIPESDLPE